MSRRELFFQALRNGKAKIGFPKDPSTDPDKVYMEIRMNDSDKSYRLLTCDVPEDIHQKILKELREYK